MYGKASVVGQGNTVPCADRCNQKWLPRPFLLHLQARGMLLKSQLDELSMHQA